MEESMRLQDAIRSHLDYIQHIQNVSPLTFKQREYTLRRFSEDMGMQTVESISNFILEEWIVAMRRLNQKVSNNSINTRLSHMRSFLRWCESRDMPVQVKYDKIPKLNRVKPRHHFYDSSTITSMLETCNQRERVIMELLFDSMMRRAELSRLHVRDFDGRTITYIGKGRKHCTAIITERTEAIVQEYIKSNAIDGYLFTSPWSKDHINPDQVSKIVKQIFVRNGIETGHAHAMRHSGATELEKNGAPLQLISRLLNHTNITTTQIYTHATESNLLSLKDKYSLA